MKRAIELAELGRGHTSPNPLVGAVVVRDDEVLGEGYHAAYGSAHAEVAALDACKTDPIGATMYVTAIAARPRRAPTRSSPPGSSG
jgi:diaminohydroxyphosphoribosylaminopyrimidine deaminase/5-amino-6-(5-phosphoribosylamino)uracil reductase